MKRHYTFRNPFYPSFKTLRKRAMKRIEERERFDRNIKIAGSIFFGLCSALSHYDKTK